VNGCEGILGDAEELYKLLKELKVALARRSAEAVRFFFC
jgi:hypothetical protein